MEQIEFDRKGEPSSKSFFFQGCYLKYHADYKASALGPEILQRLTLLSGSTGMGVLPSFLPSFF